MRVTITVPAYDETGAMLFWYPLGELQESDLTDEAGLRLRDTAMRFPIYVFPSSKIAEFRTFSGTRQAALMDNSYAMTNTDDSLKLGIRQIIFVNFTEKAMGKDGLEMMDYLMAKNGASADDTPVIRTMEDMQMLVKNEMIRLDAMNLFGGRYAINPIITDPTNGVIAGDAFLWMATKDGKHTPSEDEFVNQFSCLQKVFTWCK